jgi:RNA-binding protein
MVKKGSDLRELKKKAHKLKPVVMIGSKGLTEAVLAEVDMALGAHELIKVKVAADRDEREPMVAQLVEQSGAELVGTIGQICILYRENEDD